MSAGVPSLTHEVGSWHVATNSNAALASILRPVWSYCGSFTPSASFWRTQPSPPRASARSRAVLMEAVGQCPQPGCVGRFRGCLHDASDPRAVRRARRSRRRSTRRRLRLAEARLRISEDMGLIEGRLSGQRGKQMPDLSFSHFDPATELASGSDWLALRP